MNGGEKREDWRDWLPDGVPDPPAEELLTRDQVLAVLRRRRVKVTETAIQSWEKHGILPQPVRRWHNGAVRAIYPRWYPHLVQQLRSLQREGYPLAAIGRQLRAQVRAHHGVVSGIPPRREHLIPTLELREELIKFVRQYERLTGEAVTHFGPFVKTAERADPFLYELLLDDSATGNDPPDSTPGSSPPTRNGTQ